MKIEKGKLYEIDVVLYNTACVSTLFKYKHATLCTWAPGYTISSNTVLDKEELLALDDEPGGKKGKWQGVVGAYRFLSLRTRLVFLVEEYYIKCLTEICI